MGARNRGIGLSYLPAKLHRLAELIHWNQFLGSCKFKNSGSGTGQTAEVGWVSPEVIASETNLGCNHGFIGSKWFKPRSKAQPKLMPNYKLLKWDSYVYCNGPTKLINCMLYEQMFLVMYASFPNAPASLKFLLTSSVCSLLSSFQ
jgi:hypothetical protein